jgi:hypothetical protein
VPLSPIPAHSFTHIPDSSRAQQLGEAECDDYIGLPSGISFSDALSGPIRVEVEP